METTERKSVRRVLREQLAIMQEIVDEMGRTNVNNYPLKPHILRNWVEGLRGVSQELSAAMEQAEEASRSREEAPAKKREK